MSNQLSSKKAKPGRGRSLALWFIVTCIVFVLILIGGWQARRFFPYPTVFARLGIENWEVREFHDWFNIDTNQLSIVFGDRRLTDLPYAPFIRDGEVILPYSFVREYIDPFMFWDEGAQTLFVSTDTEIIRLTDRYVPMRFIQEMYTDFVVEYRPEFNTLIIDRQEITVAQAVRRTPVRYRPDRTAFITKQADRGMQVIAFQPNGEFVRVRTPEGLLGYVLASDLGQQELLAKEVIPLQPIIRHNPIVLSWEMITAPVGNNTAMNNPLPDVLNVISPTWFNFDADLLDGTLISFASRDYVQWAHAQGAEVWAKVFDSNHDISHAILTNYQAREKAINQLVHFIEEYNLDGININFEHIRRTDGGYYVQFLRELAVKMRRMHSSPTLSVATFVPAPWFEQYHHDLVGKTVDFVAIMTYDEHYAGSRYPGPIASLPFVRRFIRDTLEVIPPEKVIMGLPFYNRVWRVQPDGSHTSSLYGMFRPWVLVEEWEIEPVWDNAVGSYYANFVDDMVTYRIWIECDRSIGEKMNVFNEYNLAGVAGWRRGLETPGVWQQIQQMLTSNI